MIKTDKYIILQVLGDLMKKPSLLGLIDQYNITVGDFESQLEKYCFSAIYNLYVNDAEIVSEIDIDNYLKDNPAIYAVFQEQKGIEFLQDALDVSQPENFNYYYNKLKKFNLLRDLNKLGYKTNHIYCEDILNPKQKKINEKFETLTVKNILSIVKGNVAELESNYLFGSEVEIEKITKNARELLNNLCQTPEVGAPLQGDIYNTICRGARKGKMYLQTSPTNTGKSRIMVSQACYLAYPIRFDSSIGQWVATGSCEKVLFIGTEQDVDEYQTMIWSYLTDINEDKYTYGLLNDEEKQRTEIAIQIIELFSDNFIFVRVSDPSIAQIKTIIRQNVLKYGIENIFYDYIFSSPNLLGEFRDLGIREDKLVMSLK